MTPGTWATAFEPPFTFKSDGSWRGRADSANFVDLHLHIEGAQHGGEFFAFRVTKVFDPAEATSPSTTLRVPEDLMGYVTSLPGFRVVAPIRPATIGGVPASWVEVEGTGKDCVQFHTRCYVKIGPIARADLDIALNSRHRVRIYVLDVDGVHVMMTYDDNVENFDAHVGTAQALLRTLSFA